MDRDHGIKTTARETFHQRVDKNFEKQVGGRRKPRGKTQGVSKKD